MSCSEAEKRLDSPRINVIRNTDKGSYHIDNKMADSSEEHRSNVTSCNEDDAKFMFTQEDYTEETNHEDNSELIHLIHTLNDDDDTSCGMGDFKPQWLQRYATPRYFLALYCIIGLLQGSSYSYFSGCLSTFEKRYAFKSQISGYILLLREVAPLVVGVPISYFGGRSHIPRVVAMGMLMVVISCFVAVLPFLIYGPADHLDRLLSRNATGPEVCERGSKPEVCEEDRSPTIAAVTILALSGVIEGFGGLTYYALGLAYMDNITSKGNTPFYLAISEALRQFGPILGYLMCSVFLKFNENPFDPPDYGPEDPRWIGGWWMGFVLQGSVLLLFTVPLAMFPRRLPCSKKLAPPPLLKKNNLLQMSAGLIPALKRLAKNPIYILLTINTTMISMGKFGHSVILPKYMENQFRLTASDASLYAAYTPVCGPDKTTTYFSPCHAGCTELEDSINAQLQEFRNCSCVTNDYGNFITESLEKGVCADENCWSQVLSYIVLLPTVNCLANLLQVSQTVILLRSIHPADKSAALGAYECLISLFGFMPYPAIFGALIDSACLVWEKSCGQTGNCWFYDMEKFNYMLHGLPAMFSLLSALCMTGVCLLSSRVRDLYAEDDLDDDDDV